MKKIFALLLAMIMMLGIAGCGSTGKAAPAETAAPAEAAAQAENTANEETETPAEAGAPARTQDIKIIYTNDTHCHLDDKLGYAAVAGLRQKLLDEGCAVILADAGDVIQGGPYGMMTKGTVPIEIMNHIGYDVMALGNHEFDYGQEVLHDIVDMADFPMLSLNFVSLETNEPVFEGSTIIERDGVKIGFLGVTAPETMVADNPQSFKDEQGNVLYGFMSDETGDLLWNAVQKTVDELRAAGADYVIALSHLGISAATAPYLSDNLVGNTTGIDLVIDGHSHSVIECEMVTNAEGRKVPVTQTGTGIAYIGVACIDRDGKISCGLVSEAEKDENETAYVEECKSGAREELEKVVSYTSRSLYATDKDNPNIAIVRTAETNLGDLATDAIRRATGTEIAILNGGGIRADIQAGDIRNQDIINVFPFSSEVCIVKVKGQVLLDALEMGVKDVPELFGGFFQVSGLSFTFDPNVPSPVILGNDGEFEGFTDGERRIKEVMAGDEPLDPERTYTVSGTNFVLIACGNGYSMFKDSEVVNASFAADVEVMGKFFADVYPAVEEEYAEPYGQGRIVAIQ